MIDDARAFANRLRDHFVVFDPLSVKDEEAAALARIGTVEFESQFSPEQQSEIATWAGSLEDARLWAGSLDERARVNLGRATVVRDRRLIDQSDINVVFYPTSHTSFGVLWEMMHAHANGKRVYILYPFKALSPFLEFNATRVFAPGPNAPEPRTPEEIRLFMRRVADDLLEILIAKGEGT